MHTSKCHVATCFFSAAMQYDLSPQSFIMTRQNFTNVVNMKEKKNESTFSHVHNSGCDCIALTICSSNSLDDIFNKLSMQRRW